jgi:hypothetical protein
VVGRPLDESKLVALARRGDADADEELVHTYQGIALRTAYLVAGNAADAEEAGVRAVRDTVRRSTDAGCSIARLPGATRANGSSPGPGHLQREH